MKYLAIGVGCCAMSAAVWAAGEPLIRLQAEIDACAARGGGCVVVPAGRHLVGQIDLRSNVELETVGTDPEKCL